MAMIQCRISRGEDLLFNIANRASLAMIAFYTPREETRDLGSSQSREASSEAEIDSVDSCGCWNVKFFETSTKVFECDG
jgi:hypothetical protein